MCVQRSVFQGDQSGIGVQEQLVTLSAILSSVDPLLYNHLGGQLGAGIDRVGGWGLMDLTPRAPWGAERVGAGSCFFAVRTLMTLFRRELSFADSLYMWEVRGVGMEAQMCGDFRVWFVIK